MGNKTEGTLNRSAFSTSDLEIIQSLANQIAIAINQIELYAKSQLAAKQTKTQKERIEKTLQQLQITQSKLIQSEKILTHFSQQNLWGKEREWVCQYAIKLLNTDTVVISNVFQLLMWVLQLLLKFLFIKKSRN